jgi:pilus assembly protein CpaB
LAENNAATTALPDTANRAGWGETNERSSGLALFSMISAFRDPPQFEVCTMKPKTMMLMVVAVGCGLAASYMTSRLLAERGNAPQEEAKVSVLVAKTKVPAWVAIKDPEKYFEVKEVPESAVPKKALKEFKNVENQRLAQGLSEGEYVLEDKLVNSEQVGLMAKLPSGMRAIALKVNAESTAGGFVLPGFRVDVVSTLRGNVGESVAKTILQNMLVLAVDTNPNRDPNSPSMVGSTVTLAATPEETQRLALASALGELRLTLRTPDDNKVVRLAGSKFDDLGRPVRDSQDNKEEETAVAKTPPVPTLPALPADPPPPMTEVAVKTPEKPVDEKPAQTHTMTIINGEYVQKAIFVKDPTENVWTNGSLSRNLEDAPPRRSSTTPPAVQPRQPAEPTAPVVTPERRGPRSRNN